MADVSVESEATWACLAQGRQLADIVLPVHDGNNDQSGSDLAQCDLTSSAGSGALLEQTQDGAPCVITLRCSPGMSHAIGRLLVVSEARTMEVYDHKGGYCGTVRGATHQRGGQTDGADRSPFYRKQLILEQPCSACEVKLLSLAGRSSVYVSQVVLGLTSLQSCPLSSVNGGVSVSSIDLQQVQSLMSEMGANLSPGAQNLMEMVQIQQQNQSSALGNFLPLLMGGGALSALSRGLPGAPCTSATQEASSVSTPSDAAPSPAAPHTDSASDSSPSSSTSCPDAVMSDCSPRNESYRFPPAEGSDTSAPLSHAHLAELMMSLLHEAPGAANDSELLLPLLHTVCGQVTQQRHNDSWRALDPAMERRLDEMERRLKEHVDRRLDAMEQKLEKLLLGALPLLAIKHGRGGTPGGGTASGASSPDELTATTPAH